MRTKGIVQQEYDDLRRELMSRETSDALSLNNRGLAEELIRQTKMTDRLVALHEELQALEVSA